MNKLIYVMDPMCGWCFGFGKTMEQILDKFGDKIEIEVLPGGMWVDEGMVATNKKLYDFVEKSIHRIEALSGVSFGKAYKNYLMHEGRLMDSLPASKAIVTAGELAPEKVVTFVKHLQNMIFVNGRGLTAGQWEAFVEAAVETGIDQEAFIETYHSERVAELTRFAFKRVKSLEINGFPALIMQHDERLRTVTTGYEAFETVEMKIEALIQRKP